MSEGKQHKRTENEKLSSRYWARAGRWTDRTCCVATSVAQPQNRGGRRATADRTAQDDCRDHKCPASQTALHFSLLFLLPTIIPSSPPHLYHSFPAQITHPYSTPSLITKNNNRKHTTTSPSKKKNTHTLTRQHTSCTER